MRAAVGNEEHGLEVVDVPDPSPGAGELVLRVTACGICGSDLKLVKSASAGMVMGHEFCGTVVAVGSDAPGGWREGDAVTALPAIGCGHCLACLAGDPVRCASVGLVGVGGPPGAYAEYVRVGARETLRLPDGLAPEAGALVEPLAVGLHAVNRAGLFPGARVLVLGAGPIGLAIVAWARLLGAGDVVASDLAAPRRDAATRIGASSAVEPGDDALAGPFDVVFECVGAPGMLDACVAAVAHRGTVVVVGVCMQPDPFRPLLAVMKEVGMHFVVYYTRQEFEHTIDTLARGLIRSGDLVTSGITLDGIDRAFTELASAPEQCKVIVTP